MILPPSPDPSSPILPRTWRDRVTRCLVIIERLFGPDDQMVVMVRTALSFDTPDEEFKKFEWVLSFTREVAPNLLMKKPILDPKTARAGALTAEAVPIGVVFACYIEGIPSPDDMLTRASTAHPGVKQLIETVLYP